MTTLPELIHPLDDWAYSVSFGPDYTAQMYAYNRRTYDRRVLARQLSNEKANELANAMNDLRMKMIILTQKLEL